MITPVEIGAHGWRIMALSAERELWPLMNLFISSNINANIISI